MHHLLLRILGRLSLRGPPQRFQLQIDRVLRCERGVRPGGHEVSNPPRTRLVHGHNDPITGGHGPLSMGGHILAVDGDTKPPQHGDENTYSIRIHAVLHLKQ